MEKLVERMREISSVPAAHWSTQDQSEMISIQQQLLRLMINKRPLSLYFMTINFKPDINSDVIQKVLSRLADRTIISKYSYSIEQRGSDDSTRGTGLHSHWLVHTSKPLSEFKRDCLSTLGKYLGNSRHLDIRKYPLEYESDKIQYLKGNKWDPDKESKVVQDRLFRLENNLDDIYTNALG